MLTGPCKFIFFNFSDKSNIQPLWSPKNVHQPKYSNRKTYIDDVQRMSKKHNSPSPDRYKLEMAWPKQENKVKLVSEKSNFVDTCEYYSDKTPGPGSYMIATRISK